MVLALKQISYRGTKMKKNKLGRLVCAALCCGMLSSLFSIFVMAENEKQDNQIGDVIYQDDGYSDYLKKNPITYNQEKFSFSAINYSKAENVKIVKDEERNQEVLFTGTDSTVDYEINVPKDGSYAVKISYLPSKGMSTGILRSVLIDGEVPFDEAFNVEFSRTYTDEKQVEVETDGNDLRPAQKEVFAWNTSYIKDNSGKFGDCLYFYLTAGKHTFSFQYVQDEMALGEFVFESFPIERISYQEKQKEYEESGYRPVKGILEDGIMMIQAEQNTARSDLTLYAVNDDTSAATVPYDYRYQKLNCVGGTRWQDSSQWIEWEIDVPTGGLYQIGFRYKQNFVRDIDSTRALYIDDEILFEEAANIAFPYDNKFQVKMVGDDTPCLFYLDKGQHTIKMEVRLSDPLSAILQEAEESLAVLNEANWSFMMLMGSQPDIYKTYNIEEQLPEVMKDLAVQSEKLEGYAKRLEELSGKIDSNVSQINQLAIKLRNMAENPEDIPSMYDSFKTDVSTFGDIIFNARSQPLLLDYLFLAEQGAELPVADVGFFTSLKYGFLRFLNSFFSDYNMISSETQNGEESIVVWIGNGITGGRDQAMALNQLVMQDFTADKKIPVNLQLVPAGTILTATLAGVGPDVALQVGGSDPVNYALRNAVIDFTQFDDFDDIIKRFPEASYEAYRYNGGVYAIPETMSFAMMFYRTDIMKALEIVPEQLKTWQDIINILPILQRYHMNFALPSSYSSYLMFLFQNGGSMYKNGGRESGLDTKEALDAFNTFMEFYTGYAMPFAYSFEMRFRTGEIPIGVADYTTYNLLQISAPEIQGKWKMIPVPGTLQKDGTINNRVVASGSGSVIMKASEKKASAWEFIKWWTGKDAQMRFGQELESVLGAAARYNTANIEAFQMLPWKSGDLKNLKEQMARTQGIPEVPGGYMTSRNLDFAIRKVYSDNLETRSTLLSYVPQINQEIKIKREEFGLD